jgi:acyl-CoA reductase-like NAD-dependent aldehyde dehydrogenase
VLAAIAGEWPEDAVQVAALSRAEAEPLLWHEGVDAIVAHASSETCKHHLALLGEAYAHGARLRPYIPEGSGNDAFLVLEGADLARAAGALATAAFANSGQLCMAAKRVIVLEDVWPALRAPLAEAVAALRIGPPECEDTDVAPLGPGRALERARADLAEALDAGGTIVAGAGEHDGELTPTVVALSRDARHVRLWREESFGPIRSLVLARDEDEAVSLANETRFGLGAAVFGGSRDVAARLRGARIVVEEGPLYQDPHLVVGGVGDSGLGGARPKLEQLVYARRVHRGGAG